MLEAAGDDSAVSATDIADTLAEIWASVLGQEFATPDSDFFESGGNSLLAMQIIVRIEARLQIQLTPADLYERPTLGELCAYLPTVQVSPTEPIRRASRDVPAPVSDLQELQLSRLRERDLLPLTDPDESICIGYGIRGDLDEQALKESLEIACHRHEALRTCFDVSTSPPTQIILSDAALDYSVVDLREPSNQSPEDRVQACIDELKRRPFNCLSDALIRFHLLRLSATQTVLVLMSHPLVLDGHAIDLLQHEISHGYSCIVRNVPYVPAAVALQYSDFAIWQRQFHASREQQARAYWNEVLQGFGSLRLHTSLRRPAPQIPQNQTAVLERDIDETRPLVQKFCERNRLTVYSFYLAAYAMTMHELSNATSMLMFTASAQRNRMEFEHIVGKFSRGVLLPIHVDPQIGFEAFARRLTETLIRAQDHIEMHRARFVEILQRAMTSQHAQDSRLGFSYETFQELSLEKLDVESFPIGLASGPRFDLNLRVFERRGQTRANLFYSVDSYTPEAIEHVLDAFQAIVRAACGGDSTPPQARPAALRVR